jgi:hypothetical protein
MRADKLAIPVDLALRRQLLHLKLFLDENLNDFLLVAELAQRNSLPKLQLVVRMAAVSGA